MIRSGSIGLLAVGLGLWWMAGVAETQPAGRLTPPPGSTAQALRVLRAKQASTGKWFQRIDSGSAPEAAFRTSVATQFGVAESDVQIVVTTDWTEAQREQAVTEMAASLHEGIAVVLATLPPRPKDPRALRAAFPSIFSGTAEQQLDRMNAVFTQSPPLTFLYALLAQGDLGTSGEGLMRRILTDVKARIGGGTELLTQTEYNALKSVAVQTGLGGSVP